MIWAQQRGSSQLKTQQKSLSVFQYRNTWWHTQKFSCNQIYWPEYQETAFMAPTFWYTASEQHIHLFSPDIYPCISAAEYQHLCCWMWISVLFIKLEYRIEHFTQQFKSSSVQNWLEGTGLRYWVWKDLNYFRFDLVAGLEVLKWSSPSGSIDSDTLCSIPCLTAHEEPFLELLLGINV